MHTEVSLVNVLNVYENISISDIGKNDTATIYLSKMANKGLTRKNVIKRRSMYLSLKKYIEMRKQWRNVRTVWDIAT